MVNFTGYARQPEPKWPYILLTAIIIGIIVVVIAVSSWLGQVLNNLKVQHLKPAKITENRPANQSPIQPGQEVIAIELMTFTNGIDDNNQPFNDQQEASLAEGGRLYCYTRIYANPVPQTLRHVWFDPNGKILADIKIDVVNQPGNIWSYITLADKQAGKWEVQVQDLSGVVLARRSILIKP
jgi:Protein of unknown function (DUF2914)